MEIQKMLKLLCCPKCVGELTHQDGKLVCKECRVSFPIEDGIPVLLVDLATPLTGDVAEAEQQNDPPTPELPPQEDEQG